MAARVAVIGGGYAGLACAAELASGGCAPTLFEASRSLGGRARALRFDELTVDNGAHILIGAYRECLRLMAMVGAPQGLRRSPLHLEIPGVMRLRAPRLPAPWRMAAALLTARGLDVGDKLAALQFMRRLQRCSFRLKADLSVDDLLCAWRQPQRLRRLLWRPLCLAALNTPAAMASAQIFLNVLRDSLAAAGEASDLLLPTTDFSSLFPEPAARFVAAREGRIVRSARVSEVLRQNGAWCVRRLQGSEVFDQVVLATAPQHMSRLIAADAALAPLRQCVAAFTWQPVVTCYLACAPQGRLPAAMLGCLDGPAQWLFDRGRLCGQDGLIAAVISGDGDHLQLPAAALAQRIHAQATALAPALGALRQHLVVTEKRAAFAATPNLQRPPAAAAPGLWLAGDYVAGDYPATLEGAVRSGVAAARAILAENQAASARRQ